MGVLEEAGKKNDKTTKAGVNEMKVVESKPFFFLREEILMSLPRTSL